MSGSERVETMPASTMLLFVNNLKRFRNYMRYLFITLIMLTLATGGCTLKNGLFTPDRVAQKALTHTRKAEIFNSLEIKVSLIATYLNPVLPEYEKRDKVFFLMSIFIDNDFEEPSRYGLRNPDISLEMNGEKPLEIKELKRDDPLRKLAPIQNMWSHYYLVTFAKPQSPEMRITLKSRRYGASTLTFSAE